MVIFPVKSLSREVTAAQGKFVLHTLQTNTSPCYWTKVPGLCAQLRDSCIVLYFLHHSYFHLWPELQSVAINYSYACIYPHLLKCCHSTILAASQKNNTILPHFICLYTLLFVSPVRLSGQQSACSKSLGIELRSDSPNQYKVPK